MEGLGDTLVQAPQLTVDTCHYNDVAVGLAKPKLQVVRERIDMQGLQHLASLFDSTRIDGLDLVGHEPQDDSVAVRLDRRITYSGSHSDKGQVNYSSLLISMAS